MAARLGGDLPCPACCHGNKLRPGVMLAAEAGSALLNGPARIFACQHAAPQSALSARASPAGRVQRGVPAPRPTHTLPDSCLFHSRTACWAKLRAPTCSCCCRFELRLVGGRGLGELNLPAGLGADKVLKFQGLPFLVRGCLMALHQRQHLACRVASVIEKTLGSCAPSAGRQVLSRRSRLQNESALPGIPRASCKT